MRFIRLDSNNRIVTVREGLEIVDGEIQSNIGECGDIKQLDGSFITPPPPPIKPNPMEVELKKLKRTILLDRLGGIPDFDIVDLIELYKEGKLNETKLTAAVTKGWITAAQKIEIMTA
jgi:hypothetical protein